MSETRLLQVIDADEAAALGRLAGEHRILLRFNAAAAEFAVEDRRVEGDRELNLHPRWRPFGADFQQQLANRFFTDELLSRRPEVILIGSLCGASMDMVRIGALLGYRVLIRVPRLPLPQDERARLWLGDVEALAAGIVSSGDPVIDEAFRLGFPGCTIAPSLDAALASLPPTGADARAFGYGHYAFGLRDHGLLYRMQLPLAGHFDGCAEVLEVASGPAVFLEILRQRGIAACGVERDPASIRYARGLGFDVAEADALDYLAEVRGRFDGIYCSHFVEHLDIAGVERLIALIADALRPGGVALFVFPDPESIRSQLLGFWRDPEHVRFYHPDLIELMCRGHGLATEFHSHRADGRSVASFSFEPPLRPQPPAALPAERQSPPPGRLERFLARFGLLHPAALRRLEESARMHAAVQHEYIARLQNRVDELEAAVRSLWAVNQTWAWDDNAVIRVRKPLRASQQGKE